MKFTKIFIFTLILTLIMMVTLSACGSRNNVPDSIFPNIEDANIPDVLKKTVGTLSDTYYTSGISDSKNYQAYLSITFKDTTEDDYTTLVEHYQSNSTGIDENDSLLFDWGWLQVNRNDNIITVNAYIK